MNAFIDQIRGLVTVGEVRLSEHGYDELVDDGITVRELLAGVADAVLVEDYPGFGKGPCALVLQRDHAGLPVHAVWGIPKGYDRPAVLITAYRPDIKRWQEDFLRRRKE